MNETGETYQPPAPEAVPPSEEQARWWAKGNCRRCHGRGLLTFQDPGQPEKKVACPCVVRNQAREI